MEYPEVINQIHRDIYTNVTRDELLKLHNFAKNTHVAVEIGSYLGASSCAIASGLSWDSRLFCIDIWESNTKMRPDPKSGRSLYDEFIFNTEKYSHKITPLRYYSQDAIGYFTENNIKAQLLFIDGDHTEEGVKRDWELYSQIMDKGGIAVFHDWGWASVKKVIQEHVMPKTKNHSHRSMIGLPNMWRGEVL